MEISNSNIRKVKLEIINKYYIEEYKAKKEEIKKEAMILINKFNKGDKL